MDRNKLNDLSRRVIGAAMKVHSDLGPGFIERVYEEALVLELKSHGLRVERQKEITVRYLSREIGRQKLDLVVEGFMVVELKCVSELMSLHSAQLLSYLRAADLRLGLILNFAKGSLEVRRVVNRF